MNARAVATLLGLGLALPAGAGEVRRALVIAYNGSDRSAVLQYADDDGLRWREVLERLGIETTLLTVPDADTVALEGARIGALAEPTLPNVYAAVARLSARNRADRAAGHTVDAYVVYVGHGDTDEAGNAFLTLLGSQLQPQRLYTEVLDRLDADYVHLVVDACHAAGVVGARKGDAAVLERLRARLSQELLVARPRVGALYAQSQDGETHEWSKLRAGLFSHVVRSGLLGAADVNGDGLVGYGELEAFVAASIRGVRSPKGRLQVHAFPPALQPDRSWAGPAPDGPRLVLPAGEAYSRVSVEDELGVRLADVHRAPGTPLTLALPVRDTYWLYVPEGDARVARSQLGAPLPPPVPSSFAQRGMADSLVRGLFAAPFDRSFYEGYTVSSGLVPVEFKEQPPPRQAQPTGLAQWDVGLTIGGAPLASGGISEGIALAFRTAPRPWYLGARVGLSLGQETLDERVSVLQFRALALAGVAGPWRWAPYAELGGGWLATSVKRTDLTQGDLGGWSLHAGAGLLIRGQPVTVRISALLDVDWISIGGTRSPIWVPGGELTIGF